MYDVRHRRAVHRREERQLRGRLPGLVYLRGPGQYYINPDECIECGACEPECPVNAIFHESAVPDEWNSFTQRNRELSGL